MQRPRILNHWLVVFFLSAAALAHTRPEAPAPPSVSVAALPAADAAYVGVERCQSCHKAEALQFNLTHHAGLKPAKAGSATGCEMCHGPGKAHSDREEAAQGDDAKTAAASKLIFSFHGNPRQDAELCLACHQSSRDQKDFAHSTHLQRRVDCTAATRCTWSKPGGIRRPNTWAPPKLISSKPSRNCVTDATATSRPSRAAGKPARNATSKSAGRLCSNTRP